MTRGASASTSLSVAKSGVREFGRDFMKSGRCLDYKSAWGGARQRCTVVDAERSTNPDSEKCGLFSTGEASGRQAL